MQNIFNDFFGYLSKQLLMSLTIFLVAGFIFIKSYEKLLAKKISNKFKFLRDRNNEVCFEIFLFGVLSCIAILLIKVKYNPPFIWVLLSIAMLFGGALGLIPFSFIEKTKINKK